MLKKLLIKLNWIFSSQLGLDFRLLALSLFRLPRYISDLWKFNKRYSGKLNFMPCLHDRYEESGAINTEYFWQDLLVARWIFAANPHRHVDVGSRIDGFVTHVSSFREVEVFDVRPITIQIPGVIFRQADLMEDESIENSNRVNYCDSLSCLHTIEHFGLGRYGDPINPDGHKKGIFNMSRLLKKDGIFYLSTPIGRERVEFNANRVFDPKTIINIAEECGLEFQKLTIISGGKEIKEIPLTDTSLQGLSCSPYNLGMFIFKKVN